MRTPKDATSCSGCGLCALVCPLYRESPDIARTPWGRFKGLQGGAEASSISDSIESCLLCGACEPICPENIPAVDELLRLRSKATTSRQAAPSSALHGPAQPDALPSSATHPSSALHGSPRPDAVPPSAMHPSSAMNGSPLPSGGGQGVGPFRDTSAPFAGSSARPFSRSRPVFGPTVFVAGNAFPPPSPSPHPHPLPPLPLPSSWVIAEDFGADVSTLLANGHPIPPSRAADFLRPLASARRLIVADALLARWIRARLPRARLQGLGEALLFRAGFASKLRPGDFYVLDAASYHLDHARLVRRYDRLRRARGCEMNLDLHRIAIPAHDPGWLLKGRKPSRVVVESARDLAAIRSATKVPVVPLVSL